MATSGSTLFTIGILVVVMLFATALTTTYAQSTSNINNTSNSSPLYTAQDVQTLLNGKKQHLQQVQSALMETTVLSDACEGFGRSSSLYASYSSGKSSTKSELLELTKSLEYEIENIQKMQQDRKWIKDEPNTKLIADKLAEKQEAEKQAKQEAEKKAKQEAEAKLLLEKQQAEKKAKQEAETKIAQVGELATSSILTSGQSIRFVNEILNGVKKNPMKLIYKATRDGFSSQSFHSQCDEKGASVTIIKTKGGAIFGGYTGVGWKSGNGYYSDTSAFLFSLISASNEERFKKVEQPGISSNYLHSVYSDTGYGPTFGGAHDLQICSNSNTQPASYSNLGYSYKGLVEYNSETNRNYLAGTYNFLISEIEVYTL